MTAPSLFGTGRTRRAVPLDHWPLADRRAWAQAIAPGDLLEPGGAGAAWRPATRDGATLFRCAPSGRACRNRMCRCPLVSN